MIPQPEVIVETESASSLGFQKALTAAAQNADDVDRQARFPCEALEALRSAGALAWLVPPEFGGAGLQIEDIAEAVFELSRRCAAAGMVYAMHQIQVACIVRHAAHSVWFGNYLRRLARDQRLIASATSEVGNGGNIRRSFAALQREADSPDALLSFEKKASTISYGAHADDLLTTVRRSPDAEPGDQVLVLTHFQEMAAKQTGEWDTLGMRGTCSPGFEIRGACQPDQVLPAPFATIAAETMVPFSHILWAHVWLGLSTEAYQRAQKFVREQARQNPGTTPPAALRLSELSAHMAQFRATVQAALQEYRELTNTGGRATLSTIGYAVRINNLKIAASEAAVTACQGALRVCGILGYKNGGPFSISRPLRDAYSAALMIANDRLHSTNASLLLVHREEG